MSRQFSSCPLCVGVIVLLALIGLTGGAVRAEIRLSGDADLIQLQVHDTSVHAVLTALGAAYDLRFRSETPLTRSITGSYQEPLVKLVARILDGHDYVIKSAHGKIEVVVLGTQRARSIAPQIDTVPGVAPPNARRPIARALAPPQPLGPRLPGL